VEAIKKAATEFQLDSALASDLYLSIVRAEHCIHIYGYTGCHKYGMGPSHLALSRQLDRMVDRLVTPCIRPSSDGCNGLYNSYIMA